MTENFRSTPLSVLFEEISPPRFVSKKKRATWVEHQCSVCSQQTECMKAGDVLGHNFGSWQELTQNQGISMLCEVCIWGFKNKQFLRVPYVVSYGSGKEVAWSDLLVRLREPLREEAVIAPAGGRKIVAPYAQWGKVTTDGGVFHWSARNRQALYAVEQLWKVGVRGQMLLYSALPTKALDNSSLEHHEVIHQMWNFLSFVRDDKTLAPLFVKLSMSKRVEDEEVTE